jgi:hypothetical protein
MTYKKIKFTLSIGLQGKKEEVCEYSLNATDEEIQEDYMYWCSNFIDGGWSVVEDE